MQESTAELGGKVTKADVVLQVAKDFMQQKLLFVPKHETGIVFFGAAVTSNALQADGYPHVFVPREGRIDATDLQTLDYLSKAPKGGAQADAIDGLIVALDLMIKRTRDQKYNRTIHVLSDTHSAASGDPDLLECVKQAEKQDTKISVTLVDNLGHGAWAPYLQTSQNVNMVSLATLARNSGLYVKPVELRAKVRLPLVISPDVQIPVGVYSKTTKATLPTLKKRSKSAANVPAEHQQTDEVIVERTYHVADDPDGEEVLAEDRIKGHRYGQSIVPMSEYDEAALMYTCERTLTALGFAPADAIGPEHSTHHVDAVFADRGDVWAYYAFESLVDAMVAERRALIARYCYRKNSQPKVVALLPQQRHNDGQSSGLIMQVMPFAEDLREWSSASLPTPSIDQSDAVAALVAAMDLQAAHGTPPEGEALRPEDLRNPSLGRFYNFLVSRARDPAAKVSPPGSDVVNALERPLPVTERANAAKVGEQMKAMFGLKRVEKPTKKAKRFWHEAIAEKRKDVPCGEVDTKRIKVDPINGKVEKEEDGVKDEGSQGADGAAASTAMAAPVEPPARVHVGTVHPERDFERWIAHRAGGVDTVGPAIQQMCDIIIRLAEEDDEFHGKALSCLTVLRHGCVREGEPTAYNDFVRRLRLGETKRRARFWKSAQEAKLGLITDAEVTTSTVTKEEARAFLAGETLTPNQPLGSSAGAGGANALSERDLEDMIE